MQEVSGQLPTEPDGDGPAAGGGAGD